MNPRPLYARLAAEALAGDLRPDADGETALPLEVSDVERTRAIAAVSAAIGARQARRQRVRRAMVGLSLAASSILVVGAVRALIASGSPAKVAAVSSAAPAVAASRLDPIATPLAGEVRIRTETSVRAIAQGTPVSAGDHVLAEPGARASVALTTGTRLALENDSDLAVTEADPAMTVFTLLQGAVRADVAKLKAGERFLVRTADADVEVRGTSFRVAVVASARVCGDGQSGEGAENGTTRTRVEVTEGIVTVRHGAQEVAVHPGQSWPAPCASGSEGRSVASAVPSPRPHARSDGAHGGAISNGPASRSTPESAPPSARAISDLAAQNDLFAEAMREKQRGDANAAVATFDRFVATYPASALLESAIAERMKVLVTSDPARARGAAREYLARFPKGFARADAEKILATAP